MLIDTIYLAFNLYENWSVTMTDLWGCWKFYYIKIKEIHGGQKAFLLNNTSLSECAATKQCF